MEVGNKLAEWVGIGAAIEIGRQAIDHLGEAIRSGFETADKIESAQIALTALAGSAENASAIMQHLKNLAAGSIIPLDELTSASRKLLAVGLSAEQLEPLLKSLGDVAAGTGTDVGEMAEMFVRVAAEGSVSSRVLREMGKQGLPVVAELAKHFNTTAAGVHALAEEGRIGFKDLQAAFEGMSGPGGKFAGLMEAQSNTVGGIFKRLATTLSFSFAEIDTQISEAFNLKGILSSVLAAIPGITTIISNGLSAIVPYVQMIKAPIMAVIAFITDNWEKALRTTVDVWYSMYNFVSIIVAGLWDTVTSLFNAGFTALTGVSFTGKDAIQTAFQAMVNGGEALAEGIKTAINTAAYYLTQFRSTAEVVGFALELTMVRIGNITQYGLGVAAKWVEWFALDFIDIFSSMANTGQMMFQTLTSNLVNIMTNLPGLIKGSVKFDDLWKPLTSSLELHMEDLPKIAARGIGGLEGELEGKLDHAKTALNKGLGAYLKDQDEKSGVIGKGLVDGIKNAFTAKDVNPVITPTLSTDNLDLKITPKIEYSKLLRVGSGEAGLASYVGPHVLGALGVGGGAAPAAVGHPFAPAAPGMPTPTAATDDPAKIAAKALDLICRYIVKWDTNPPLAAVSM
jgi:tape measure domain-containing protein